MYMVHFIPVPMTLQSLILSPDLTSLNINMSKNSTFAWFHKKRTMRMNKREIRYKVANYSLFRNEFVALQPLHNLPRAIHSTWHYGLEGICDWGYKPTNSGCCPLLQVLVGIPTLWCNANPLRQACVALLCHECGYVLSWQSRTLCCFWNHIVFAAFMPMPKATVDENDCTVFSQDNVGMTRQTRVVQSITEPSAEQESPHQYLRLGVLPSYRSHTAMALLLGQFVHCLWLNFWHHLQNLKQTCFSNIIRLRYATKVV